LSALAAMVPQSARKVLLLGQDLAGLGKSLKSRPGTSILTLDGQEENAAPDHILPAATLAGEDSPGFEPGSVDAVVCHAALEQAPDPAGLLRRARTWLQPEGRLLARIPSVRNHTVVRGLLEGHWSGAPVSAGISRPL